MRILLKILKWIFLTILGLILILVLLLALDQGSQKVELSPEEKNALKAQKGVFT